MYPCHLYEGRSTCSALCPERLELGSWNFLCSIRHIYDDLKHKFSLCSKSGSWVKKYFFDPTLDKSSIWLTHTEHYVTRKNYSNVKRNEYLSQTRGTTSHSHSVYGIWNYPVVSHLRPQSVDLVKMGTSVNIFSIIPKNCRSDQTRGI